MKTLIQNGRIVTPKQTFAADLLIEDGKIAAVGENLPTQDAQLFDAAGCLLFPGFIDGHTHLDMDNGVMMTADNFESGTRAALVGGTTCLLDFATQDKGGTLVQAFDAWNQKAQGNSSCDYGFHMAITDCNPAVLDEIDVMVQKGVTSFKLYMAYDNLRVSDGQLYEVLKRVKKVHGIIGVHCENGDLVNEKIAEYKAAGKLDPHYHPLSRPDYVEAEAVSRYCYLAKAADVPVNIVHLSTKLGLAEARKARTQGQKVYIESCPQYFALDDSVYDLPNFESAKYVCSPPVRKKSDQQALWEAVKRGEIDTISTDHCSFHWKGQKEYGKDDFSKIPNGMPGLEHRPVVMYTLGVAAGKMSENQMAAMLSENTARLFGMYPQKGVLLPGSDADIVVWDPNYRGKITAQKMEQRVDYTPFEGMEVIGRCKAVFLHGEQVVADGEIIKAGLGRYVARGESEYF